LNFSDYIPTANIIPDLKGSTKIEIIKELLYHMKKLDIVSDFENTLDEILQRESHLSTGLEKGVAIPHSKIEGIDKLSIVFGIKKQGVDFESYDAQPAFLIFLVLSPKNTSGPHIQALAMISRNLKNREIRESIKKADSAHKIANILASFD
jgi:fructose-specific phosphotransferase system IIA component